MLQPVLWFCAAVVIVAGAVTCHAAQKTQMPCVAGQFYPAERAMLSARIDSFLDHAQPASTLAEIFCIIVPHAGYDFSGPTAAYGYKLIKDKPYKTVVILAPIQHYLHKGFSVYPEGKFRTPLSDLEVDSVFVKRLTSLEPGFAFISEAFVNEYSVEVQLPFLQKTLKDFRIVPIMIGECSWDDCRKIAAALGKVIGNRKDVLVVVSTDMYHGYDYIEAEMIDTRTFEYVQALDAEGLYRGLK